MFSTIFIHSNSPVGRISSTDYRTLEAAVEAAREVMADNPAIEMALFQTRGRSVRSLNRNGNQVNLGV